MTLRRPNLLKLNLRFVFGFPDYRHFLAKNIFRLKIDVGDLQSEETRDLVMELHLDPVAAPYTDTPQHVFSVKVHYYNVAKTEMQIAAGKLTVLRPGRVHC